MFCLDNAVVPGWTSPMAVSIMCFKLGSVYTIFWMQGASTAIESAIYAYFTVLCATTLCFLLFREKPLLDRVNIFPLNNSRVCFSFPQAAYENVFIKLVLFWQYFIPSDFAFQSILRQFWRGPTLLSVGWCMWREKYPEDTLHPVWLYDRDVIGTQ